MKKIVKHRAMIDNTQLSQYVIRDILVQQPRLPLGLFSITCLVPQDL